MEPYIQIDGTTVSNAAVVARRPTTPGQSYGTDAPSSLAVPEVVRSVPLRGRFCYGMVRVMARGGLAAGSWISFFTVRNATTAMIIIKLCSRASPVLQTHVVGYVSHAKSSSPCTRWCASREITNINGRVMQCDKHALKHFIIWPVSSARAQSGRRAPGRRRARCARREWASENEGEASAKELWPADGDWRAFGRVAAGWIYPNATAIAIVIASLSAAAVPLPCLQDSDRQIARVSAHVARAIVRRAA